MASISVTFTGVTVTGVTKANPGVVSAASHGYTTGDFVFHEEMDEMVELNGNAFDIETINANSYWLRKIGDPDATRIDTSGFVLAETTGGTSSLAYSAVLDVKAAGDDVIVTLVYSGAVATVALERERTPYSGVWTEIERWTTDVTTFTFAASRANERYRLRLITWTSGSVVSTLADADKVEESFHHADGTEWMEVTQATVTFRDDVAVDGNQTIAGTLNITGTLTVPGTLDVATLNAEVIEAGDASLGINGLDAAQGGALLLTGGTSTTAGNAGGAVSLVGGTPGSTGIGGAVNLTGAVGGSGSGAGGALVLAGGAATTGATAGGLASFTGGASTGSGTGGVASVVGGAGSAATGVGGASLVTGGLGNTTGAGGAVTLTGGAGGDDAVGGIASLVGGAAGGGNRAGGATLLTGGAGQGTAAGGAITITSGAAEAGAAVGPGASGALTVASGVAGTETTGTAGASGAIILESVAGGAASGAAGIGGASGALTLRTGAGGGSASTTGGVSGVGGAVTISTGAGGQAEGTGVSAASGALVLETGTGGAMTLAAPGNDSIVAGASGTLTIRTGAGGALTAGNSTAGAGGAIAITGGAGGEAIEDADDTGGAGANVTVTAGAGGDGQSTGKGGSVILAAGNIGTTGGGTAAIAGSVILRGIDGQPLLFKTQAPTTDTTSTNMTEAELLGGLHEKTAEAAQDWQVPTGAEISAAITTDLAVGDSFLFRLVNLGGDGDTVTLTTAASGTTMVGNMAVTASNEAGADLAGWAVFLVRNTGAGTWVFYRVG